MIIACDKLLQLPFQFLSKIIDLFRQFILHFRYFLRYPVHIFALFLKLSLILDDLFMCLKQAGDISILLQYKPISAFPFLSLPEQLLSNFLQFVLQFSLNLTKHFLLTLLLNLTNPFVLLMEHLLYFIDNCAIWDESITGCTLL